MTEYCKPVKTTMTGEMANKQKRIGYANLHGACMEAEDTVSERLRRWTRNPLGSARRGSNPLGVDCRGGEQERKIAGGG